MNTPASFLPVLLVIASVGPMPAGEHWPRFRGADGQGVVEEASLPVAFGEESLAWSAPLPGPGSSSPVLWGGALFITSELPEKKEVALICLDAKTGAARWQQTLPTGAYRTHRMNNAAASTPAVGKDTVVVSWYDAARQRVMLSAFSHTGEKRWDFSLGDFEGSHGVNLQPVIEDGRVVAAHLHRNGGSVTALEATTGKVAWQNPYPDHRAKASYITPLVRKVMGTDRKEVVVASTGLGLRGFDFATGKEHWAVPDVFHERTIVSPVDILAGSGGDDCLLTAGCKNGVFVAVRPADVAENAKAAVVWRFDRRTPYVPTPVSDGHTLYVLEDGGNLSAVDPATGKVRWSDRLMGNFYASPLLIGGKLCCLSREGELFVAEVGKDFKLLGTSDLKPGEESEWADATPAVADGCLYVRLGARIDCHRMED